MEKKRIGFVATRLAGTDGVSLETFKLAHVLERMGHEFLANFLGVERELRPYNLEALSELVGAVY